MCFCGRNDASRRDAKFVANVMGSGVRPVGDAMFVANVTERDTRPVGTLCWSVR